MTRKESLFIRRAELRNELLILRGEQPQEIETEGWLFQKDVRESREIFLKRDIEGLEQAIIRQKALNEAKAKREAYFQTPEGAAFKAQQEHDINKAWEECEERHALATKEINDWIKTFLGEHWKIKHYEGGTLEIGIWNDKNSEFIFGQTIEIRCSRKCWGEARDSFEINVGTTGSFNPLEQNVGDRALFYIGLGQFLSADISRLNKTMFDLLDSKEAALIRIREAKSRLNNLFES